VSCLVFIFMFSCLICIRSAAGPVEFDMLVCDLWNGVGFGFVAFRMYLCS